MRRKRKKDPGKTGRASRGPLRMWDKGAIAGRGLPRLRFAVTNKKARRLQANEAVKREGQSATL